MAVMCSVAAILLGCHVYLLRMVWLFAHVRTTEADLAVAWAFCRTPYMSIWSRAWDCSLQLWYRGSCKVWSSPKSRQILHNSKNRHWAESWRWSLKAQHPASTLRILLPESQDVRMSGPVGPYGFPTLSDIIQRHGIWFRRFDFFPGGTYGGQGGCLCWGRDLHHGHCWALVATHTGGVVRFHEGTPKLKLDGMTTICDQLGLEYRISIISSRNIIIS